MSILSSALRVFDVTGIVVFALGAFFGFLLTGLVPIRAGTWWLWPGFRVAWQVGGALWCGLGIWGLLGSNRLVGALVLGAVGVLLAINPLLDLVRGPLRVEDATLVGVDVSRGHFTRASGARHSTIHGRLTVEGRDGQRWTIKPLGMQANRMERMVAGCRKGQGVRVVALRHLDVLIELDCQ